MTNAREVAQAFRQLVRRPLFSGGVILLLGLALGGNMAVFTMFDALVLRGLPFQDAVALIAVGERRADAATLEPVAPLNYQGWQPSLRTVELGGYAAAPPAVVQRGESSMASVAFATAPLFSVLRVRAALGDLPTSSDDDGATTNVWLSEDYWRRAFGARPDVLGSSLQVDNRLYVIRGVLPAAASSLSKADLWLPLTRARVAPNLRVLRVVGRIKSGYSLEQTRQDLDAAAARMKTTYPLLNRAYGAVAVEQLEDRVIGPSRPRLMAIWLSTVFLLLIACSGIITLQMVRASERRDELWVRLAIGGSWWHLFRQVAIEGLLLAAGGVAIALLVASWCLRIVAQLDLPMLDAGPMTLSARTAAVGLTLAAVIGIAIGVLPLLRIAVASGAMRPTASPRRSRAFAMLMITEAAVATAFLGGALLVAGNLVRLSRIDTGFQAANVYAATLKIPMPPAGAPSQPSPYRVLVEQLAGTPGFTAVGLTSTVPLGSAPTITAVRRQGDGEASNVPTQMKLATAGYFSALGIPLTSGRLFTAAERRPVALINRRLADRLAQDDPVGLMVQLEKTGGAAFEVVGVVGDAREIALTQPAEATIYLDADQVATTSDMHVLIRSTLSAAATRVAVGQAVARAAGDVPISQFASLASIVDRATVYERVLTILLGVFAVLATVLAAIGVYVTVAYMARTRAREFAIRAALGERRGQLFVRAFASAAVSGGSGVALGVAAAVLFGRFLSGFLYGTAATDAVATAASGALVLLVVTATAYTGARWLLAFEPVNFLHHE